MSRIQPLAPESATGRSRDLLDRIAKNGKAVNIQRVLAHSPAALQAYLGIGEALGQGELGPAPRERIPLVVAQENGCSYCLSTHTFLGARAGLSADQMLAARRGVAEGEKERVVVDFARTLVRDRTDVSDEQVQRLRVAGLSDGEIVEVVAHVVQNIFTNYIDHVADTAVDFPLPPAL